MYLRKLLVAVALLGLILMAAFSYFVYKAVFAPNTAFEGEAYVRVPTGADYIELSRELHPLLEKPRSFDALARRKGFADNVKPGRYLLREGMNNNEIIAELRSANRPIELTFNNQHRLVSLAGRISGQIEADSLSLVEAMTDTVFLSENGFDEDTALGMYIPNTYEFYWNTSATEFRSRMLREYRAFWDSARIRKAEAIGLDEKQVMVLASIVQMETAMTGEQPRVAGVYMNRLRRGMLLQADPTVIFALRKATGDYRSEIKRVLYDDLEIDSPYNTYMYIGLPPGPIGMPDISSIEAVLHYEKHDYLFFVADTERPGYHLFARTLAQHNQNKQKYKRWIEGQEVRR